MRRLLVITGLALAIQALPLSEPATEVPVISQAPLQPSWFDADSINKHVMMRSLSEPGPGPTPTREASKTTTARHFLRADHIKKHVMMRSLPQPGPGPRPTREASKTTTARPFPSADLITKHMMMRSLPQPGPGPRLTREAPISSTEATTAHPFLSTDLINQHVLMGWSLPQPGPGPRPTREAPVVLSEPTEHPSLSADLIKKHSHSEVPSSEPTTSKPSLFSPELIQQHILMGWSLPQPGFGPRPTVLQPDTDSSLSPVHLEDPRDLALSTLPPRSVRAAPRPLPAHKAHGPRALLPYGPYATRKNVKV